MIAQSSCICERGTTSSRAPPSMSTGIVGGSLGACRRSRVSLMYTTAERERSKHYLEIGLPLLVAEEGERA